MERFGRLIRLAKALSQNRDEKPGHQTAEQIQAVIKVVDPSKINPLERALSEPLTTPIVPEPPQQERGMVNNFFYDPKQREN